MVRALGVAYRRAGGWRRFGGLAALLAGVLLGGCSLAPDRPLPDVLTADRYAHAPEGQWLPADSVAERAPQRWWTSFQDAGLDRLMGRLADGSPDLAQAEARYREATADLRAARAGFFPTVSAQGSMSRAGQGGGGPDNPANSYSLSGSVQWEADLWGRVRGSVAAAQAGERASAADLQGVRLSLQSTLAQAWFGLISARRQEHLLDQTLAEYEKALQMTRNRQQAGVASPADVAASRAQLEQARAQRIRLAWQTEQQVHALAVLVGDVPGDFEAQLALPEALPAVPQVPVGVPSVLLLQRPDIAAARERVAQANARIGVSRAAWFPDLTLGLQGGFRAAELATWLTAPARFWSLGPALALTLFDGGARSAATAAAEAAYDVQAAAWRQTVLESLREVEDALVQSQALVDEQQARERALAAARETLRLVTDQYRAGLVDYLNVVQAQASALSAEQAALDLHLERLTAAVRLRVAQGV
ncbi:efflux transporter outer membrane subunit [Castellaniella sp.]|uniref:efflux transporter outer membrane subunit n=1 Tax=Castellaniella sp. TaxID=1955812 RepID=UPI0035684240